MTRLTTLFLGFLALFGASATKAQVDVPPGVIVEALHIVVSRAGNHLVIVEDYFISNQGDETYAGAPNADGVQTTLGFTLPPDASGLIFDGPGLGERYVGDTQHFADTQPVPPGSATTYASFSYALPYREGLTLTRNMAAPIIGVALILRDEQLTVTGAQLTPMGTLNTQGGLAQAYAAGPLAANEPLALTFLTGTALRPPERNYVAEAGLGLIVLSAGLGIAYRLGKPAPPRAIKAPTEPPEALREAGRVFPVCSADFADNALEASDYRRRRAQLKQTLRDALHDADYAT